MKKVYHVVMFDQTRTFFRKNEAVRWIGKTPHVLCSSLVTKKQYQQFIDWAKL